MTPPVLWSPPPDARSSTRLGQFMSFCERRSGRTFGDYDELWEWSIGDGLEACWSAIWDFFEIRSSQPYERVLDARVMPGAHWFDGARLNYAEHVLRSGRGRPDDVAIVAVSQSRDRVSLTWGELAEQVARARVGLQRLGVGEGDRVAAYLPTFPRRSWRSWRPAVSVRPGRHAPLSSVCRRCSIASAKSSRRCCWRSTGIATAATTSAASTNWRDPRWACRPFARR